MPIGIKMEIEEISPVAAIILGIVSSVVFLLCFDTKGNFHWPIAVPTIAFAAVGANFYHQRTGHPVIVVGGVFGFIVYMIFGFLGVAIGKLFRWWSAGRKNKSFFMDEGPFSKPMFKEKYPNIADWVDSCGWIELGQTNYSHSMVRVLDEGGGMIWENDKEYKSLDELLDDLEKQIAKKREEFGV